MKNNKIKHGKQKLDVYFIKPSTSKASKRLLHALRDNDHEIHANNDVHPQLAQALNVPTFVEMAFVSIQKFSVRSEFNIPC